MQYELKEITLHHKDRTRRKLVIEFSNPNFAIFGEYLMVDAPLLNWHILKEIKYVLANEKERVTSSGNRTIITITKEKTVIEDLLDGLADEDDLLAPVIIETETFYDVLVKWYDAVAKFNARAKS